MGRKKKEYITQIIRKVRAKYYLKQKKINGRTKVYFEQRIPPISLPTYAPDSYYLIDEDTFTKILKIIDYLQAYNSYLEEKIKELALRTQELENKYTSLLGRYYLLRNYWAAAICRDIHDKECKYETFQKYSELIEHDLSLMTLQSDDYIETDTTTINIESEMFRLKRKLRKIYALDNY